MSRERQPKAEALDRSSIAKRSITIDGHKTSISLEREFWDELIVIADSRGLSTRQLVAEIDASRRSRNLSSSIRVAVLNALKERKRTQAKV